MYIQYIQIFQINSRFLYDKGFTRYISIDKNLKSYTVVHRMKDLRKRKRNINNFVSSTFQHVKLV